MSFWTMLRIFLVPKTYRYNPKADIILKEFINHGKILKSDMYCIYIKLNNTYYSVWAANFPYADLTSVETFQEIVYTKCRPSRKVQSVFWEWATSELAKIDGNHFTGPWINENEYVKIFKK